MALRGLDLDVAPRRDGRAAGPQRRREEHAAARGGRLLAPDRGTVRAEGDVALLLQTPSDYLLHERVVDELPADVAAAALASSASTDLADADPRDLSGGERQRLALGIVLAGRGIGGGAPPAVVALDEPTRGMDQARKRELAERLGRLAAAGAAVIVATHDVEFAARVARRCVLLGGGRVVADGSTSEVLSGGRYFTTEVARVLGPGRGRVLPEEGARCSRRARRAEAADAAVRGMSWQAGSALIVLAGRAGGPALVRAPPPAGEARRAGRGAGGARGGGARAVRRGAERAGDDRRRAAVGLRARARARVRGRRARGAGLERLPRPGAVDALADARLGRGRARRRAARVARAPARGAAGRWPPPARLAGLAFGAWMDLFTLIASRRRPSADGYLAIAGISLPFNVAHAIGNAALALAFGPAFVRVLERFRRRLDVRWDAARTRGARAARATITPLLALALVLAVASDRDRGAAARCATACATWSARRTATAASAPPRARHRAS